MISNENNIFPAFHRLLQRADKEKLLGQRGAVIWLTGLSGSGKTTLASAVEARLHAEGYLVKVLDGDNLRFGINSNLGFTDPERYENIRRASEIGKLFADTGLVTICCFISPKKQMRELAKTIIGEDDFHEVYVDCPLDVCEQRDVKGLYKLARSGEIKNFTGISDTFEIPVNPSIVLKTHEKDIDELTEELFQYIIKIAANGQA